uniref:RNA-dependent RNA polymerase n=1 Tax=Hemipteran jingmen-related virus TaxID=2822571 RepID=A0A8A6RPC5_9FLAV|nr:RNA-dependent RNA polymerase [Hemipteran jingmen-related virus]
MYQQYDTLTQKYVTDITIFLNWLIRIWNVIYTHYFIGAGTHSSKISEKIFLLKQRLKNSPWLRSSLLYKIWLNNLSTNEFKDLQNSNPVSIYKSVNMVSRGYLKLQALVKESNVRISGRVLDLCAGRGGWDQYVAGIHSVSTITSVTLGPGPRHVGHEKYTDLHYKGREKVDQIYMDIKDLPPQDVDWVLFDGGESKTDFDREKNGFLNLIKNVDKHITEKTGFILKVLVPLDLDVVLFLEDIQKRTNKGNYYRCVYSKPTSQELYFISTPRRNLRTVGPLLMNDMLNVASVDYETQVITSELDTEWPALPPEAPPPPDLSLGIHSLGPTIPEPSSKFRHWKSLGIYPQGSLGSSGQSYVDLPRDLLHEIVPALPEFLSYKLTDTTPLSFLATFRKKIDTTPIEHHPYVQLKADIYDEMASWFLRKGFQYKIPSEEELIVNLNKQGAAGALDYGYSSVGEFISLPYWREIVEDHEQAHLAGRPIAAIWKTMGKREKKKLLQNATGSRMVAYMGIPDRIIESKYLSPFANLTKPSINPAGVGGLGLHDLGERLKEVWKGAAINDDVAGYDTRVSATEMLNERDFFKKMVKHSCLPKEEESKVLTMIDRLYAIYIHPTILIPMDHPMHVRSELIQGQGQRMSGSYPTYIGNTLGTLVNLAVDCCETFNWSPNEFFNHLDLGTIGALISGDDKVVTAHPQLIQKLSQAYHIGNSMGKIRKDIGLQTPSPIHYRIEEVEFCSHSYSSITYYDSYSGRTVARMMPTRAYSEVLAKSCIWLGASKEHMDKMAWCRAMSNQILVNYHHMRLCRRFGLALNACTPEHIILTDTGHAFLPRPWMRPGDILDVINECLFGESTHYPVEGFRVREFRHLGYLVPQQEKRFGYVYQIRDFADWGRKLPYKVQKLAYLNGGDFTVMYNVSRYANLGPG